MRALCLSLCSVFGLIAAPAHARDAVNPFREPDDSALFRQEQAVVTVASRYAQTVRQAPSIVTVLTDADLRSRGCRTLADALGTIPGITISVSPEGRSLGTFRGVTSPDNNKFLLLIDGVPWYDGAYTHAWIDSYIPLVNVRQIEVIKGPGSAIYGTNAFAGVVNVVTYTADDLQGGFARAEVGSDGRRGAAAVMAESVDVKGREVEVRAFARFHEADGDGLDTTPKGRANVGGLKPERAIAGGLAVRAGGLEVRADLVDYQHTYFINEQDDPLSVLLEQPGAFNLAYRNQFFAVRYDAQIGRHGRITPYLYTQRHNNPGSYAWLEDVALVEDDVGETSAEWRGTLIEAEKITERYDLGMEIELQPRPAHRTVGGVGLAGTFVERLDDVAYVDFNPEPVSPADFSVDPEASWLLDVFAYAQHTWTATWWLELTAGARVDNHNFFGAFPSPRAGVLLIPADPVTVKLLYGRAFRAPNARELAVRVGTDSDGNNRFTAGNPNLSPEVIDTVEGELSYTPGTMTELRGAAFFSAIGDEIDKASGNDPKLGDAFYDNVGGATVMGGEAQAIVRPGAWELDASYALTIATDTETGFAEYGVPPHTAHGRATWSGLDIVRVSLMVDAFGERPRAEWTPDSKLEDGPAYALVHMGVATVPLADGRVSADLSLRNLLNSEYRTLSYADDANATTTDDDGNTVAKFPNDLQGPGRSVVVGVEMGF